MAERATGGELGCGIGSIEIVTETGIVTKQCSLDPVHVFGSRVNLSDIYALLNSRADFIQTGHPGPMSGDVEDLCFVSLSVLTLAEDPSSIPIILPLLKDKSETIRAWAAITLIRLGNNNERIRDEVKMIPLPREAIADALGHGETIPAWVIQQK